MPRAVFFSVPAHGHVNPSLPLVAELTRRGHDVIYFTTGAYRQRIEAAGASVEIYTGVEDDYFEANGLNGTEPQKAAQILLRTSKAVLPELLSAVDRLNPDYILYDCMCPWGYYIAQITGLPSVSSFSLQPLTLRALADLRMLRLFLPAFVKGSREFRMAGRIAKDLGKQYSVKPLDTLQILNVPGDVSISYTSSAYIPYAAALPEGFHLVGWTLQENPSDEPFAHTSGRPLIYVSLGTVSNENEGFYRLCIDAFRGAPYDVLISTGGRFSPEHFGPLPDNVTVKSWVPQAAVLRQAALFITHGGLNSIHDGLYCGLPRLIVPQQVEQTVNGLRVIDLRAGLMLKQAAMSVSALRASADRLLSEPAFKAAAVRVGDSLRTAGGPARAVDAIEALLRTRQGQAGLQPVTGGRTAH
jgi:MGT family glycosyltransferase